jgi:quinol monooxygenase YgiN
MAVRLVIHFTAAPGKGGEFAKAFAERCLEVQQEPGCEQYEIFQSALEPDRLVLLERWRDEAALSAHAEVNRARPPVAPETRSDLPLEREDYEYKRSR